MRSDCSLRTPSPSPLCFRLEQIKYPHYFKEVGAGEGFSVAAAGVLVLHSPSSWDATMRLIPTLSSSCHPLSTLRDPSLDA